MITGRRPRSKRQPFHKGVYGFRSATMVPEDVTATFELADLRGVTDDKRTGVLIAKYTMGPATLMLISEVDQPSHEEACYSFTQALGASGTMSIPPTDQMAFSQSTVETKSGQITFAGEEEYLDWDFALAAPSNRASGVILAELEYVGRSKPISEDELRND